jgi:hypothetical protein
MDPALLWKAILSSPCPKEDIEFLVLRLPEIKRQYEEAERLRQADADGKRGGRPRTADDGKVRAVADRLLRERPHLAKAPKPVFDDAVSQALGWGAAGTIRVKNIRLGRSGKAKPRKRSWEELVARNPFLQHTPESRRGLYLWLDVEARAAGMPERPLRLPFTTNPAETAELVAPTVRRPSKTRRTKAEDR